MVLLALLSAGMVRSLSVATAAVLSGLLHALPAAALVELQSAAMVELLSARLSALLSVLLLALPSAVSAECISAVMPACCCDSVSSSTASQHESCQGQVPAVSTAAAQVQQQMPAKQASGVNELTWYRCNKHKSTKQQQEPRLAAHVHHYSSSAVLLHQDSSTTACCCHALTTLFTRRSVQLNDNRVKFLVLQRLVSPTREGDSWVETVSSSVCLLCETSEVLVDNALNG